MATTTSPASRPSHSPSPCPTSRPADDTIFRPSNRHVPWQHARIFDEDRELAPTRRAPIELPRLGERGGIDDIADELVHEQQATGNNTQASVDKKLIYLEWNDVDATDPDNWDLPKYLKGTNWGNSGRDQFIGDDAVQKWQLLADVRNGVEKFTLARQKERMDPEPENEYIGIPLMFNTTEEAMRASKTIKIKKQTRDPFYETKMLPHRQDYQPRVSKCDRHLLPQLLIKRNEQDDPPTDGEADHLFHSSALIGPKLPLHIHQEQIAQLAEDYRRNNLEIIESGTYGDDDQLHIFQQNPLEEDETLYEFEQLPLRPPSFLDNGENGQSRFYPKARNTVTPYEPPIPSCPLSIGRANKRKSTCAPRTASAKRPYKWKDGVAPQRRLGHVKYPKGHIYHNLPKRGEFVILDGSRS